MSERPIQVGDLVQVVRWSQCGCGLGEVGRVSEFLECENSGCGLCKTPPTKKTGTAAANIKSGRFCVPLEWLKRIPPLDELEGERTQETIREPA